MGGLRLRRKPPIRYKKKSATPGSRVLALELGHHIFTDCSQSSKHTFSLKGHCLQAWNAATIEVALKHVHRQGRGHIALIPLHNEGEITEVFACTAHIYL